LVTFGVSAQQHRLVTLDDRNQPVRPGKLWCDNSTAEQAERLNRALGNANELIERTGNAMVSGYTAPKTLWLKENEPKNFARRALNRAKKINGFMLNCVDDTPISRGN
jgi:xylulokinase